MTVLICERCGDVAAAPELCRCCTPYDRVEVRRRLTDAISRARATDAMTSPVRKPQRAA
ncbi:hypothetical protein GCM10017691_18500 [Pseudonocardia petroleophila]|uniref:Uncharacterized protein n=1 Tax=Pseudonocardia petroleophila TaxID=37331 RepID=A0A7G7MH41_9PSEU|nr:hypothetical protein [Pseudonocardia petroleophila]QNG52102.1 hypothetical protein H6H00_29315 [Pseudonocardia petroleophila]